MIYDPYRPNCELQSKKNFLEVSVGEFGQHGKKLVGDMIYSISEDAFFSNRETLFL